MQGWSADARQRGLAYVVSLGLGGVTGLATCWSVNPASTAELSPAQIVALRFPQAWSAPSAPARAQAIAARETDRGQPGNVLFSPHPTYALASASTEVAGVLSPVQAMAYADPTSDAASQSQPATAAPKERTASLTRPTERVTPPPRPPVRSRNVLNDEQIASLKERLNLTPKQAPYWPAVEAALRKITWPKTAHKGGTPAARIDPNSKEVQELKSAAIPLIMMMSGEQKDEVRRLAHVMGLGSVATQF